MRNFFAILWLVLTAASSGCTEKSSTPGTGAASSPTTDKQQNAGTTSAAGGDLVVSGQIAIDQVSPEVVGEGINLANREIAIKDSNGGVVGKAVTSADGQYRVIVPGTIAVDPNTASDGLALTAGNLSFESLISDTADQSVIGIRQALDLSKSKGRVLALDKTQLAKVTAIRGQALLNGAADHTGIAVYIPGTSYAARTDSAGMFLMTFLAAGTYELRFEKDGYLPTSMASVVVNDNDTTKISKATLRLSGGAADFSVKQLGSEGISRSRHVEWLISPGSADRFKGGLELDLENKPYGPVPDLFAYDFPDDGIYAVKMVFANADGFEQTVTRSIIVDTTKPKPDGLSLADRKTLNLSYSNERFVIAYHADCKDIDTVAILPEAVATPNDADFLYPCLSTAAPNRVVFTLPATESVFSYKIWARDIVGNVSDAFVAGDITFDAVAPSSPVAIFSDQTSGSTLGTDITTVNVTLSTCDDIEYVLISESQLLQPDVSKFSQACNTMPNGSTFTFANNISGLKTALVWAMDFAGNISQISTNAAITLDQTAPVAPSFVLADPTPASTGYANGMEIKATPANCSDTTHVLIAEGLSTAPNENDTRWRACTTNGVTAQAEGTGTRTLNLWARDIGGNVSQTSTSATIIVDTTPPVAPSFNLADATNGSLIATNAQVVNVNISSCADVDKVALTASNTQPAFSAFVTTCATSGISYSFDSTSNGNRTVYLWVRDLAGNISTAAALYSITVDTTLPGLPSSFALADTSTGSAGITNSASVNFTVNACPAGEYVYIGQNQTTAPSETSPNWMACTTSGTAANVVSSGDGSKSMYLWKKDEAGNINGPVTATITMDGTAPNAPVITTPASSPAYQQSSTLSLSGTAEANATITITGGTATVTTSVNGSGNWSANINLSTNTSNDLVVTATDAPGNASSSSNITVVHDTIAPSVSNVQTLLTDSTLDLTWATSSDAAVYTIDWGTTTSYGETAVTSSTYSTSHAASLAGMTQGTTYYYRIRVTDQAGNTATSNDYTSSVKTYIPKTGSITTETWNDTSTSYYISGNVTVASGSTLTIGPGVTIRMAGARRILVDGTLIAQGQANNPITITANSLNPNSGFWDTIQFSSSSTAPTFSSGTYTGGNILEYVNLAYGGSANHMVNATGAGVLVKNCTLSYAGTSGTYKAAAGLTAGASLYIWNSSFSNNYEYGVYADAGSSGGTLQIKNSTLAFSSGQGYNRKYPIAVYSGPTIGTIDISNNTISGYHGLDSSNGATPIYIEPGNSTITTISNNRFYPSGSYVYGIICYGICTVEKNILVLPSGSYSSGISVKPLSSSQTITVQKNIVVNALGGVYFNSSSIPSATFNVNNNVFVSNWNGPYCSNWGSAVATYPYSTWFGNSHVFNLNQNLFYKNTGCGTGNAAVYALEFTSKNYAWSLANNNFIANTNTYLLYTNKAQANGAITAANNYWQGSTSTAAVNNLLYDFDDNSAYAAVTFTSPSSTPYTNAPISPPQNLNVSYNGSGSFTLSWTANPESDVAGYRVYYKTSSGYPWNGTGATEGASGFSVGNVTSANVTLPTGQYYYFTVTAKDSSFDGTDDQVDGNESWHSNESSGWAY